jgi:tRNA threonylcarbamoyl adenosine modification protein YeaZ
LSTHLHLYLETFLPPQTWADLAFISVAKGPGGFTGTRLGVVTARTLAQQLGIPLFGVSTLAAVAWHEAQMDAVQTGGETIAVQMPAHRGEVYGAIYLVAPQRPLRAVFPDAVLSLQQWQQTLEQWQTPYRLVQAEAGLGDTVVALLELAYLDWQTGVFPDWSTVLPFYGQSPV